MNKRYLVQTDVGVVVFQTREAADAYYESAGQAFALAVHVEGEKMLVLRGRWR